MVKNIVITTDEEIESETIIRDPETLCGLENYNRKSKHKCIQRTNKKKLPLVFSLSPVIQAKRRVKWYADRPSVAAMKVFTVHSSSSYSIRCAIFTIRTDFPV